MPKETQFTPDQDALILKLAGTMMWKDIAALVGRPRNSCNRRWHELTDPPADDDAPLVPRIVVPEDQLRERDYRKSLRSRSITAWLLGDPLPGYSAGDDPQELSRRIVCWAMNAPFRYARSGDHDFISLSTSPAGRPANLEA